MKSKDIKTMTFIDPYWPKLEASRYRGIWQFPLGDNIYPIKQSMINLITTEVNEYKHKEP